MNVKSFDSSVERRVLIGLITSTRFLQKILSSWQPKSFDDKSSDTIASWCIEYFQQFGEAPKHNIEPIFRAWSEKFTDDTTVEIMDKFLSSLSGEYTQHARRINSDYLLAEANKLFREVRVRVLAKELESDLVRADLDKAEERIATFRQKKTSGVVAIDPFLDKEFINTVLSQSHESLFKLPSGLGKFFGSAIRPKRLIGIMAPDKTGKSFWVQELGYQAMLQRRKVAFFAIGDLTDVEMGERLLVRASGLPLTPCTVNYPTHISKPNFKKKEKFAHVKHKELKLDALSIPAAVAACEELVDLVVRSRHSHFRLSCHSNFSVNVDDIAGILNTWRAEDFVPEVVIVDYPDILLPPKSVKERRDQIDVTWMLLKKLAQDTHSCVIVPTQTSAEAYGAFKITRSHFSNDKRKLAHVNGMLSINMTAEEKEIGLCRLNWNVLRGAKYDENRFCYVAQCLELNNPAVLSAF